MAKKGIELLRDRDNNKSTAFTRKERDRLGLRGLLPYAVSTQEMQVERIMNGLRRKEDDMDRYISLNALMHRNERLYYRVVLDNIEELLPIIYTPTVGQACKNFSHIFSLPKGFYVTPEDKGKIASMLDHWNHKDIKVIVVTDGERILGLGDLGSNGMGIPIGKLALYTAFGGIDPSRCLPVMFDMGTDNEELLEDVLYLGYPKKRIRGQEYMALMDEFVQAIKKKYPGILLQFEDFKTLNAYSLLKKYRNELLCFNDDIQGTASVALAGVYASCRITGKNFKDLKLMFLGAGSAATGIADLICEAFQREGLSRHDALNRLWFIDSKGLVVRARENLADHKRNYAHDHAEMDILGAIDDLRPDILIGATGSPNTFTQEVIEKMSAINERPVIFALSNPTSKAECTAEEAYKWSKGKAVFVSGSPFGPVKYEGRTLVPGQGNNAYIFPGLGMGLIMSKASYVSDDLLICASKKLAEMVSDEEIAAGTLYPSLANIRDVSLEIATAVASMITKSKNPNRLRKRIRKRMFDPKY